MPKKLSVTILFISIIMIATLLIRVKNISAKSTYFDREDAFGRVLASKLSFVNILPFFESGYIFELFHNQKSFLIYNLISNGSFESINDVSWVFDSKSVIATSENELDVIPIDGLKMLKISTDDELITSPGVSSQLVTLGSELLDQLLQKDIALQPQCLSLWVNVYSQEKINGFDEPFFLIKLDEDIIYQSSIQDFEFNELYLSGWKHILISLPNDVINPQKTSFSLSFKMGNFGDNINSPVIFIDDVSTNCVLTNSSSRLYPRSISDNTEDSLSINYHYAVTGEQVVEILPTDENHFIAFTQQYDDYILEFWLENLKGLSSNHEFLSIYFSDIKPQAITILNTFLDETEFVVKFKSPQLNFMDKVQNYDFRLSQDQSELEDSWDNSIKLNPKINNISNIALFSPQKSGSEEIYTFELPIELNSFYLAVKSIDMFGNYSDISNIIYIEKP